MAAPTVTPATPVSDKPTPSTTDSRDDAGAEDENSDTPTPTPSGDRTVVFQKVDQDEEKVDSGTAEPAGRTLAEKITARTGEESAADDGTDQETAQQPTVAALKRPAPSVDETGEIPQVDPLAATTTAAATSGSTAADVAVREDDAAVDEGDVDTRDGDDDAVEEKTSITGVVLLAIIGVVLGVVVFKGFEMLWDNLSRPIVAVLAVLVTAGMVAVVRALRTANDGLSMFLAAVVGLVMTLRSARRRDDLASSRLSGPAHLHWCRGAVVVAGWGHDQYRSNRRREDRRGADLRPHQRQCRPPVHHRDQPAPGAWPGAARGVRRP
ncbi:hypothetical protein QP028_05735 [Corynebacterium suedekumii]|nr:hypothetical protein QP028_05735 [Corynebacterium suedekumii]